MKLNDKLQKYTLASTKHLSMKWILVMLSPLLFAGTCNEKPRATTPEPKAEQNVPACVQQLLDTAAASKPPVLPLEVVEYEYKGRRVYLFQADCCDFLNIAYDEQCNRICAPSGGFTGGGDGKCRDFDSVARKVRVIWKKKSGS